jgi:dienelactone hydrolase
MASISRIFVRLCVVLGCLAVNLGLAGAETVQIPSPNGTMTAALYLPSGSGPFPVVIFSHGRAGTSFEREGLTGQVTSAHVSYWHAKGFAVVAPIRPGYGPGWNGQDFESSNEGRNCQRMPDFAHVATSGAAAIVASVDWVRHQPWARKDRILLEGRSVGGLSTVAAAAEHPPGVVGYINFAGGTGGDPKGSPSHSCHPEGLTEYYGSLGASVRMPGIWFYADNDLYWGPQMPKEWGAAFNAHGGHARLVFTGPSGNNGHFMLDRSPQLWQPELDAFVKARGF